MYSDLVQLAVGLTTEVWWTSYDKKTRTLHMEEMPMCVKVEKNSVWNNHELKVLEMNKSCTWNILSLEIRLIQEIKQAWGPCEIQVLVS